MPPPALTDEMIRKMCPQNHPPPLTKVYNIAPRSEPNYLNILPSIKPAAYKVNVPTIMNNMAISLVKDRSDNMKVLMSAQQEVLDLYEKPLNKFAESEVREANVDAGGEISSNLRGSYNPPQ